MYLVTKTIMVIFSPPPLDLSSATRAPPRAPQGCLARVCQLGTLSFDAKPLNVRSETGLRGQQTPSQHWTKHFDNVTQSCCKVLSQPHCKTA